MVKKNGKVKAAGSVTKTAKVKGGERGGSLAASIDPFLLAGGKTIKEIAAELAKKGGELAKGKDLAANVRARMVSFTRKGWRVVKDDEKRVKLVQKKG